MPMTPIVLEVDETTGEASDVGETNLKLTFPASALTEVDIHAPFYATPFPEFGFTALGTAQTEGSVECDLQDATGEALDPENAKIEAVVPKSIFEAAPSIHEDLAAFTTGRALIIPA